MHQQNGNGAGIGSAHADRSFFDSLTAEEISQPEFVPPEWEAAGDIVDAELVGDPGPSRPRAETPPETRPVRDAAKKTFPDVEEWTDFFSRIVLRTLCRFYVSVVFRGIDEDELSERELERLMLTADERKQIAMPWAEFAYKNKLMRKHGRSVVAFAGSFESLITLGAWVNRVNRIAAKHRKPTAKVQRVDEDVSSGQAGPAGNGAGANGGYVDPDSVRIWNPGTS